VLILNADVVRILNIVILHDHVKLFYVFIIPIVKLTIITDIAVVDIVFAITIIMQIILMVKNVLLIDPRIIATIIAMTTHGFGFWLGS